MRLEIDGLSGLSLKRTKVPRNGATAPENRIPNLRLSGEALRVGLATRAGLSAGAVVSSAIFDFRLPDRFGQQNNGANGCFSVPQKYRMAVVDSFQQLGREKKLF